jgi:hypothetical protein
MANSHKLLAASLGAALLALPLTLSSPASAWERGGGRAFEGGLRSNTNYGRWGNASNMGFNRGYDRRDFGRDRWGNGGLRSTWGYGRASYGMGRGWGYSRMGYGGRGNWGYGRFGYARRGWGHGGWGYGGATAAGLLGGAALGAAAGYPYDA